MTNMTHGINSIADRRYYHFVAVAGGGLTLPTYWRKLEEKGRVEQPRVQVPVESSSFTLEHRKFRYKRAHARGDTADYLSDRGRGGAPFHYDLFAANFAFDRDTYLFFGYPFASLALDLVGFLVGDGFFKNAEFQNVDLRKWLSSKNRPFKRFDGLSSSAVGVRFVVGDDKSLTAVRLGGHNPFEAAIYKDFIGEMFEGESSAQNPWIPDQCVLACEREAELKNGATGLGGRVLHSRLHIDKAGNFKFYMHSGCVNATLLPYAIGQIRAAGCLRKASGNPLLKADREESE